MYVTNVKFKFLNASNLDPVLLNGELVPFSKVAYVTTFYVWSLDTIGVIIGVAVGAAIPSVLYALNRWQDKKKEKDKLPRLSIIYEPDQNMAYFNPEYQISAETKKGLMPHKRKYLNVEVRNDGKTTAEGCKATATLMSRTKGCSALSPEPKLLEWHETGNTQQDIYPHGGQELFRLCFSDSESPSPSMKGVTCARQEGDAKLYAYVCAAAGESASGPFAQHGMCLGEFELNVKVRSKQGVHVTQIFRVKVTRDWEDFSMTKA